MPTRLDRGPNDRRFGYPADDFELPDLREFVAESARLQGVCIRFEHMLKTYAQDASVSSSVDAK
jgi:hypothetical protein